LLSAAFAVIQEVGTCKIACYVNCDIILFSSLLTAVSKIKFEEYLMLGRRLNADITERLSFEDPQWEVCLLKRAASAGRLDAGAGGDYFVFPREGKLRRVLPFAVGRPGWDNWFIQQALELRVPVIDVSRDVTVIHQNHGYEHVRAARDGFWRGPEGDVNIAMARLPPHPATVKNATHVLRRGKVRPNRWVDRERAGPLEGGGRLVCDNNRAGRALVRMRVVRWIARWSTVSRVVKRCLSVVWGLHSLASSMMWWCGRKDSTRRSFAEKGPGVQ
jgi:hypothetical protein